MQMPLGVPGAENGPVNVNCFLLTIPVKSTHCLKVTATPIFSDEVTLKSAGRTNLNLVVVAWVPANIE